MSARFDSPPGQFSAAARGAPPGATAPLDPARLAARLAAACVRCRVEVVGQIDSTNSELLRRARDGRLGNDMLLLAAEEQTGGRGRLGRPWQAAPGAAITVSLARHFALAPARLAGLSLVCGLAACTALAPHLGAHERRLGLKWPNDVLIDGRKLAGILIEVHARAPEDTLAVIGIGLNVTAPPATATIGAGLPPADLAALGVAVDRTLLLADLASALDDHLRQFSTHGFAPFVAAWNARHAWQNRAVTVHEGGTARQTGTARGVDAQGHLLLDTPTGPSRLIGGEVSLRRADGAP